MSNPKENCKDCSDISCEYHPDYLVKIFVETMAPFCRECENKCEGGKIILSESDSN